MAKLPVNRYASAAEMLEALDAYVRDPSITFDYQYVKEEVPEKAVNEPMAEKRTIRRPPEAQKTRTKAKKKKPGAFMPVLLGITAAFALACAALCWVILSDSSNIMNKKADIVLSDFSGMTQDEVNASPQVATTTKVPSLIGMSVNDARTLLVQKKLGLGGQTEQYSDQPVGTIISQSPGEGASAKLNTRVSVVVSAGPEPAPEPEAPSESTSSSGGSGGGWWSGLFGSGSSSSSSTAASESSSASSGSTGGGLGDWWTSWLG